jgi:hypothetical protein
MTQEKTPQVQRPRMKMKRIKATKKNRGRKKKMEKMRMRTNQMRRWIQTKVGMFFTTNLTKYMIRVGGLNKV